MVIAAAVLSALLVASYLFWRHFWFFRDPPRSPPAAAGILSPADGTVVYVRKVAPGEDVIVIKQGVHATVRDILRQDVDTTRLVIGVFMSPFDVHYNRAPIDGTIDFIHRHPAIGENLHMGAMHWRAVFDLPPHYADSVHIVQNERTVTHFVGDYKGEPLSCYVVQIGARTVNGIDSYFREGDFVARGAKFGMIRIGSQVDVIVTWRPGLKILVQPGERVRAGETRLIE
jgi:phosphatidylserine decarboxylase